jgi:hypothetical protein
MNDPKGLFKMKFIGKPNGVFMKGAPGNYVHGKTYNQPWGNGNYPYWELMEEAPVLKAPELSESDNVFDEEIFVAPEEETAPQPMLEIMVEAPLKAETVYAPEISVEPVQPIIHDEDVNLDPNTRATIEPYMSFNTGTGELSNYDEPIPVEETISTVEEKESPVEPLDRDELLKALEFADVEVKKGTRTTTLKKMVDRLEP